MVGVVSFSWMMLLMMLNIAIKKYVCCCNCGVKRFVQYGQLKFDGTLMDRVKTSFLCQGRDVR